MDVGDIRIRIRDHELRGIFAHAQDSLQRSVQREGDAEIRESHVRLLGGIHSFPVRRPVEIRQRDTAALHRGTVIDGVDLRTVSHLRLYRLHADRDCRDREVIGRSRLRDKGVARGDIRSRAILDGVLQLVTADRLALRPRDDELRARFHKGFAIGERRGGFIRPDAEALGIALRIRGHGDLLFRDEQSSCLFEHCEALAVHDAIAAVGGHGVVFILRREETGEGIPRRLGIRQERITAIIYDPAEDQGRFAVIRTTLHESIPLVVREVLGGMRRFAIDHRIVGGELDGEEGRRHDIVGFETRLQSDFVVREGEAVIHDDTIVTDVIAIRILSRHELSGARVEGGLITLHQLGGIDGLGLQVGSVLIELVEILHRLGVDR